MTSKPKVPIRKTLFEELKSIPNLLTLARIFVVPVICYMVYENTRVTGLFAAILFGFAALTDMVDGYLARRTKQITIIGKFLDPLADKLLVLSVLITLLALGRIELWVVALIMAREVTITGLRSIASSEGMVIAAKPLGKYKASFQMIGLIAMLVHHPYVVNFGVYIGRFDLHNVGLFLVYISVFFSVISAIDYFNGFAKEFKRIRTEKRHPDEEEHFEE